MSANHRTRITLQQVSTGLFVGDNVSLVLKEAQAQDFATTDAAIDYCIAGKLRQMEIIITFLESSYEIRMPLFATDEAVASLAQSRPV